MQQKRLATQKSHLSATCDPDSVMRVLKLCHAPTQLPEKSTSLSYILAWKVEMSYQQLQLVNSNLLFCLSED